MTEASAAEKTLTASYRPDPRETPGLWVRNGLFCALAVSACVLVAHPVARMAFSDEFSYDKTALEFARTGHMVYNGWATAMLGWLIPWGALFIKVFGFSFTVMRFSMLPIAFATVFLFHQILGRFGIRPVNAIFGTLALSLSPVFLPSAASYMTDVPGLLVIFLCVYMCQSALRAQTDRATVLWLLAATGINLVGGTVRQIAWLGALVMVPATAWLLRRRRGVWFAGILSLPFSVAFVLVCLHWFNSQPYSVPEHIIWAPLRWALIPHLGAQLVKTLLCLFLVLLPVTVAWLPTAKSLDRRAWQRVAAILAVAGALWGLAFAHSRIDTWIMPWLMFLLSEQSSLLPGMFGTPAALTLWIRLAISFFVLGCALIAAEQVFRQISRRKPSSTPGSASWQAALWILGPFSLSYFLLLIPRGAFDQIQDRYLVGLTPVAIVFLLKLYQDRTQSRLPAISIVMLAGYAIYSVAGTHDFFAESRAQVRAVQMVERSGVPRTSIQTGFPDDGWVQIQNGGHINEPRLLNPPGAYNPDPPDLIPDKCRNGFTKFAPVITPRYFILFPWFKNPMDPPPPWCFTDTKYPTIHYTTWLPPFHATIVVQQLANQARGGG